MSASQISAWRVHRVQLRVSVLFFFSKFRLTGEKHRKEFIICIVTLVNLVLSAHWLLALSFPGWSLLSWLPCFVSWELGWLSACQAAQVGWPAIRLEAREFVDDLQKCELYPILMSSVRLSEGLSFSVSTIFGSDSGSWGPHLLHCLWEVLLCPWVSNKKTYWFWFWITIRMGIALITKKAPTPFHLSSLYSTFCCPLGWYMSC